MLVKKAVGFNEARGDSVQVVNAAFRTRADELAVAAPPLWEQPWFWSLVKQGAGGLVVLLLALVVLRPLLRGLPGASPPEPTADQLALGGATAGPGACLPSPHRMRSRRTHSHRIRSTCPRTLSWRSVSCQRPRITQGKWRAPKP